MFINFKDKMYIYHPDGKFTEAQLIELLEAARKKGYDEGYEAAKAYYNKPYWWYYTNTTPTINLPYITCTSDSTNSNLTSTTATATTKCCNCKNDDNKPNDFEPITYTFKCDNNGGFEKILTEESDKPITLTFKREFKYYGTEE